jgi:lipopolysaccharide transport system ATP-binding protein
MCSESIEPAIAVRDLGKTFHIYDKPHQRLLDGLLRKRRHGRAFRAVRNVSFEVARGETLGIIGRNGSGKSTLLQMVTGVLQPTEGDVVVPGRVAALLELGAGFNPEFTGRENAELNAAILGLSQAQIAARMDDIIAFSELREFIEQPVKTYSSGMYVRLAFSVAIHVAPSVLIIDEALAVGDARFQAKCMERIRKMKAEGTTILFVSHDVAAVRLLCDRAVWLDKGVVRMIGDVQQVTSRYIEFLFADAPAEAALPEGNMLEDAPPAPSSTQARPPMLQWGSAVGSILDAGVFDASGTRRDVYHDGEAIEVRIRFRLPDDADPAQAGPAFSFKDVQGSDLIVASSFEDGIPMPAGEREFEARYTLHASLAPGDYYLVAALEDRRSGGIAYFDYVEGAHFFSIAWRRRVHGRFVPVISQRIDAMVVGQGGEVGG